MVYVWGNLNNNGMENIMKFNEIYPEKIGLEDFETCLYKYTVPFLKSKLTLTDFSNDLSQELNVCPKLFRKYLVTFMSRDLMNIWNTVYAESPYHLGLKFSFPPKAIYEKKRWLYNLEKYNKMDNFINKKIIDLSVSEVFQIAKEIKKILSS